MDAHTATDEWETSPFDGGLEEAARMADGGFSGAIRSGNDWLFIADGDPVAVVTDLEGEPSIGDVDAFEDADGEAYEAPHPGVARLVPMVALGGEVRGQYFSDDTPIGTVQETLEDGAFTGYVELSENVLSGDYYVVFDEGEAAYVAIIGSTEQLVTEGEAERKTKNEVGIYSVVAVDLPEIELPEPPSGAGGVGGLATDADDGAAGGSGAAGAAGAAGAGAAMGTEPGTDDEGAGGIAATAEEDEGDGSSEIDAPAHGPGSDTGGHTSESGEPDSRAPATGAASSDPRDPSSSTDDRSAERGDTGSRDPPDGPGAGGDGVDDPDDPSGVEVGTAEGDRSDTEAADAEDAAGQPDAGAAVDAAEGGAAAGTTAGASDDLRRDVRDLRATVDRLADRVAALESGGGGSGTATAARTDGPSLSPEEALSQTTLFVREGTRGGPTLDDAHDGRADRDALARNLDLEWHTRFEEAGATVDGQPYVAFLESSQAYEFVRWLTTDLIFEIRVTDSVGGLSTLYDAIPEIDRVFFDESVTVEDGAETAELTFDVVVRDRNGAPLFVASLDDHRDPTPSSRIERLVTDVSDFCAVDASVVGAFAVTASYFEPEALEVAHEATTSSLLSREKHRSYVNLTRKSGFHLCLVEARDAAFHLTVPEL